MFAAGLWFCTTTTKFLKKQNKHQNPFIPDNVGNPKVHQRNRRNQRTNTTKCDPQQYRHCISRYQRPILQHLTTPQPCPRSMCRSELGFDLEYDERDQAQQAQGDGGPRLDGQKGHKEQGSLRSCSAKDGDYTARVINKLFQLVGKGSSNEGGEKDGDNLEVEETSDDAKINLT